MKKRILFLSLTIMVFMLSFVSTAFAADGNNQSAGIQPRYTYVQSLTITAGIKSSDGYFNADVLLRTREKCDIVITTTLEQKVSGGWKTLKTWRNPSSGSLRDDVYLFSRNTYVDIKGTYRVTAKAHVTSVKTGGSETVELTQTDITF